MPIVSIEDDAHSASGTFQRDIERKQDFVEGGHWSSLEKTQKWPGRNH